MKRLLLTVRMNKIGGMLQLIPVYSGNSKSAKSEPPVLCPINPVTKCTDFAKLEPIMAALRPVEEASNGNL